MSFFGVSSAAEDFGEASGDCELLGSSSNIETLVLLNNLASRNRAINIQVRVFEYEQGNGRQKLFQVRFQGGRSRNMMDLAVAA